MKVSELYGGQFFKAGQMDKSILLTVKKVAEEAMQGNANDTKAVVYFQESDKGLVLNATNATTMAELFGDDTDWVGKQMVLYATTCDFQGKRVDCLRVRAPKNQAQPVPVPEEDANGEDCPF